MNKEKYTLQEVTTPALEREWLDFPKRIYKGCLLYTSDAADE